MFPEHMMLSKCWNITKTEVESLWIWVTDQMGRAWGLKCEQEL